MKRLICSIIICILLLSTSIPVSAASYYGIVERQKDIKGGFFMATTRGLDAKWSSSNRRFVLNTMWAITSTNYSWIECGFMDGDLNGANYNGFYTARGVRNSAGDITSYNEYKITGPSTATGTNHTYEVKYEGNNNWGVYVDYIKRRTFSAGTVLRGMQCGLETNAKATTAAKWNPTSLQVLNTNGNWANWARCDSTYTNTAAGITRTWKTQFYSIYTSKSAA